MPKGSDAPLFHAPEAAREVVADLVERYRRNADVYASPAYKETQARREFIDPFFEALGWDISNRGGLSERFKDVVHEASLRVGEQMKAPDYCFRFGGQRMFYLEAKKPSVNIKDEPSPAFQLRRYGWNAKLAVSILTDFREFAVYDCRHKPGLTDPPATARRAYYTYDQYLDKLDDIYSTFSKEAVGKGSFDRYALDPRKHRGTTEVDDDILREIETWREDLARDIARNNRNLSVYELNHAVQATIDRILFLRIAEDRGVEGYGRLGGVPKVGAYRWLCDLYHDADAKYNAGLFDFAGDRICLDLAVSDKVLWPILKGLYYPQSPYEFSVIRADILGAVYEQFLGKVIRLTAGHQARIEEKPEVKKAGGVYYTPIYIVDYIVKHTVGEAVVEAGTPEKIAKLKILDPACGSGSFLLGAYQYLLDWHLDYYTAGSRTGGSRGAVPRGAASAESMPRGAGVSPAAPSPRALAGGTPAPREAPAPRETPRRYLTGRNPAIREARGGYVLTLAKRKEILLNNIYGVDIDRQAVEVTKLNLLLKCMEGVTEQASGETRRLLHDRILPNIDANIKCGNSLIGWDYFSDRLLPDEEEKRRVNPFDWESEFAQVMKAGGFDCVIGNPPYGAYLDKRDKACLSARYPDVSDFETAQYFICQSAKLARRGGWVSFIVPNTLFLNVYAQRFRRVLSAQFSIRKIVDLSAVDVFASATVRTAIPVLVAAGGNNPAAEFTTLAAERTGQPPLLVDQSRLAEDDEAWVRGFAEQEGGVQAVEIRVPTVPLDQVTEASQGLIPYDKYRGHDEGTIRNRIWHSDHCLDHTYRRELRGGDVSRYAVVWNGRQWISYGPWLGAPRRPDFFTRPRLLFREITDPKSGLLHAAYTEEEYYNNPSIINCISRGSSYSLLYLLGVANSRLIAHWHFASSPKARKGVFPKILVGDVRRLPIRPIDFSDPADVAKHDKMVSLVEVMLELHKRLPEAKSPGDRDLIQRQIDATDKAIDRLVYELYELTEDEIRVVEGER